MILTCPNCSTRFLLSAQLLAPQGRRVRCCKCSEEWFQEPDADELIRDLEQQIEDIPESVKPVPEGSSVPALRDEDEEREEGSRAVALGYAAATGVFVLIFITLLLVKEPFVRAWPPSAGFYTMIGLKVSAPGRGIEFDRVQSTVSGGTLRTKGYLLNLTSDMQSVPMIEAALKDSDGNIVDKFLVAPPESKIEGESELPFTVERSDVSQTAESLHLRFVLSGKAGEAPHAVQGEGGHEGGDTQHGHEAPAAHSEHKAAHH